MEAEPVDLASLASLDAFVAVAEARLSPQARTLIQDGAGTSGAVRANIEAWARWKIRTRVLRDVSAPDLRVMVLGEPIGMPVLIAPSGLHGLSHPDGEFATASAAAAADTIMVMSMAASLPVERVAQAGARLWFQLYWGEDRGFVKAAIDRAAASGASALCLTVDMPGPPLVSAAMRAALGSFAHITPPHGYSRQGHLSNSAPWDHDARLTWKDLDWLKAVSPIPIVLKGVMHGADARLAVEAGMAGVVVSNHGGRALEDAMPTADVLAEVVQAADGRLDVLVDGGIRRGADVIKALALGARAVMIGRPAVWGLAAGGAAGTQRVLDILRTEIKSVMGMAGLTNLSKIDPDTIARPR